MNSWSRRRRRDDRNILLESLNRGPIEDYRLSLIGTCQGKESMEQLTGECLRFRAGGRTENQAGRRRDMTTESATSVGGADGVAANVDSAHGTPAIAGGVPVAGGRLRCYVARSRRGAARADSMDCSGSQAQARCWWLFLSPAQRTHYRLTSIICQ